MTRIKKQSSPNLNANIDILKKYTELNNSYKKELIFHLGAVGGFYSEFNNMVFAILYCLKYQYKFVLYSADANFGINKGWTDFFKPFCKETRFFLHRKINKRTSPPSSITKKILVWLYKFLFRKTFLTYELWNNIFNPVFEKETFNIPQLEINGNLKEASRIIIEMIYHFNDETILKIEKMIYKLNIKSEYLAINIRRGDKDTEFKIVDENKYITKLKAVSNLKDVFVFTDDYRVIESLSAHKAYTFFSLVNERERGYVHGEFLRLSKSEKEYSLIKMFAAVEVFSNSNYGIGTYTTNPGLFFGARMPEGRFYSVQKHSWFQFDVDDVM